jgi:hypothetical protein
MLLEPKGLNSLLSSHDYTNHPNLCQERGETPETAKSPSVKAKDADVYLLTAQTFSEFPDLVTTDGSFKELRKVSDPIRKRPTCFGKPLRERTELSTMADKK